MRNLSLTTSNVVRLQPRLPISSRRRLRPADLGLTSLALAVFDETDTGILVSDYCDPARAVWVPKSMLQIDKDEAAHGFIAATLSSQLAQQKSLWPRFIDRTGWSAERSAAFLCVERLAADKRLKYRGFKQPLPFPGRNAFA